MTPRPDPSDPASFNRRFVKLAGDDGHTYETIDQPPLDWVGPISEAPTLLLCHGFPDQAIGFRYQIHEFASRGYRVLVPCQLGYGGTSKPLDVRKYSFKAVAYDMNLLLDACGVKGPVIVVGHDWGGMVAWRFANYFPHRVQALVAYVLSSPASTLLTGWDSVCTPYQAPATAGMPSIPDEVLFRKYLPQFGYQLYFQSDAAILELDEVIDQFLQPMHSASYRRGKDKPKEGEMSHWVLEGRLQGSIRSQIKARRAGNLPLPPPDKVSVNQLERGRCRTDRRERRNWTPTSTPTSKEACAVLSRGTRLERPTLQRNKRPSYLPSLPTSPASNFRQNWTRLSLPLCASPPLYSSASPEGTLK
jgi:soluble epoxide hydrolase/lipid-phosphate phosphatase